MRVKSLYIKKHLSLQVTKWVFFKNNFKNYIFLKLFLKKYGTTLHYPLNGFSRNYLVDLIDPRQFNLFKFSLFSKLLYNRTVESKNIFNVNGGLFDLSFLNFYFFHRFLISVIHNFGEKNFMNRLKIGTVQIANTFLLGSSRFFFDFSSRLLGVFSLSTLPDSTIFIKFFINKLFKILFSKYALLYFCFYNINKLFFNISCFFCVK